MRSVTCAVVLALVLGTGASCVLAQQQSIVDLHGPDGLAFSVDDPLRVQAGVHNGVFFLSLNGGERLSPDPGNHGDDVAQLGFLNLSDMTISRLNLMQVGAQWQPPDPVEGGAPSVWTGASGEVFYAAGDALKHVMNPATPSKETPAARLDAEVIKNKIPLPGFLVKLEELRFEGIKIDRAQVVGILKQDGNYEDALTASAKLVVEAVHVKLGGLLGGLLGGGDGWMRIGGSTIGSSGSGPPPVPQDLATAIDGRLQDRVGGSGPTLQELGVTRAGVIAAARGNGDCDAVKSGLSANPDACAAVGELVAAVKGPLESFDNINQANDLVGDQRGGVVQTMIDKMTKNGDWLKFKNPAQGANADLVNRVVKNKLADEIKKFSHRGDARPKYSGAHMFNSLYMYGGIGRWLVNRREGNQGFESPAGSGSYQYTNYPEGLVENFVFARLGRIDTTQLWLDGDDRPCALWQQLDLITQKPKSPAAPVPWPPGIDAAPDASAAFTALNTGGAVQLCADEAAIGKTNDPTEPPEAFASMVLAVNPKPATGELHAAFFYRSKVGGAVTDTGWQPVPPAGAPRLPMPGDWNAAGRAARYFAAELTNKKATSGPVPGTPDAQSGAPLEYNWDYDGDGNVDADFGRGVIKTTKNNVVATCYIQDPNGRTGAGGAPVR